MRKLVFFVVCSIIGIRANGQLVDEGSEEKASRFLNSFNFQDPMYFSYGITTHPVDGGNVSYTRFN